MLILRAFRRFRQITHLQILNANYGVVFADFRCGFMKVVFTKIGYVRMQALYFTFRFLQLALNFILQLNGRWSLASLC